MGSLITLTPEFMIAFNLQNMLIILLIKIDKVKTAISQTDLDI